MKTNTWRERLIDPQSPERRPRRAAYALPTLFTAGNIFLGFYALLEILQGSLGMTQGGGPAVVRHFQYASIAIGVAVFLDGLDGRIARMTNTVSDFGREMDSLADLVTFGIAPAVMAFAWGVRFVTVAVDQATLENLQRLGYFVSFFYLICGAARLARFNVQKNPIPKNPGRPDRKYFVGLPIPSAAATVAAIVYAAATEPLTNWVFSAAWLVLLFLLGFLMISTWRYPSFKGVNLMAPRSFMTFVFFGCLIFLIAQFPQPVLLGLAICYVGSGIVIRIGGILRRRVRQHPRQPEHQVG